MSNLGEWDSADDDSVDEDIDDGSAVPTAGPASSLAARSPRLCSRPTWAPPSRSRSNGRCSGGSTSSRRRPYRPSSTKTVVDEDVNALARLRTAAEESVAAALTSAAQQDDTAAAEDGPAENAPTLYHPTLEAFVRDQLAPMYRRDLEGRGRVWCPQWWRHAEAIARLEAMWRAWEHLRLDPATGMSVWFRDHADQHMAVLFDPEGPFKRCAKGHGERLKPLPIDAPPEGMFQEDQ